MNPTTIERASDRWLEHFITAAQAAEDAPAKEIITDLRNSCRESLYMQDYSYFREAAGLDPSAVIKCQLYPLAIVIDWRGSAETSVTIDNRELIKQKDLRSGSKKQDQNQKITDEAHDWQKTLALNASTQNTLVPHVIVDLIGLQASEGFAFIRQAYKNFDFKGRYVPTDLRQRGFPPEELDGPKFHNYAYARCILSMWHKIRTYGQDMLALAYPGTDADDKVLDDQCIQAWSNEMWSPNGADLPSFPTISTFEELVDCVTMCIHIASPQHTAVNDLQNYYQSFVVNKPPCLYAEPPASLQALLAYTEKQLVEALPMNHPQEWLLSSHIPYLLRPRATQALALLMARPPVLAPGQLTGGTGLPPVSHPEGLCRAPSGDRVLLQDLHPLGGLY